MADDDVGAHKSAEELDSLFAATMGKPARSDNDAEMVIRACLLINRFLAAGSAPPPVGALAKMLFTSRSRLYAAFQREIGQGVGLYARKRRMEFACRLLLDNHLSIADVAKQTGYPSLSSFDHSFKAIVGLSPCTWRDNHS